ncbi:MAG: phosphatase PAP2 family protein [Chthoniobacterales bacterium]
MNASRFIACILLISTSALHAKKTDAPKVIPPYKMPSHAWFLQHIVPPPPSGSWMEKQDVNEVLALQKAATPKQIALAKWDFNLSVFTFSEVLGKKFTAKRYPQTAAFFLGLNNLIQKENNFLKSHFKRPHPFEVDPHVKRIVVAPPGYSYPSYHSARCVVFSNVLAMLDPANKAAFHQVAEQVEIDRVLAGEHFPSDIRAGKYLGQLIYAQLLKDKNFLADLKKVQAAEWTPPPAEVKNLHIAVPSIPK